MTYEGAVTLKPLHSLDPSHPPARTRFYHALYLRDYGGAQVGLQTTRRKPQGARSLADTYTEQFLWVLIIYLRGRIKHIRGASGDCPSSIDNSLLEHVPNASVLLGAWSTGPHQWGRSGLWVQAVSSPGASCSLELFQQLMPTGRLWLEKLNIY